MEGLIIMNFEEVYEDHVDIIFNYLRQRLKDSYLIEDILQDTFYAVYQNLNKLRKEKSIKSWIISIAHNKMVDRLRKEDKEALPVSDETINNVLIQNPPSDNILMEEILRKLDGEDRQILYGLYALQLSCKELGEIMNLPEGTVKSRCYYTRKKLKDWLKEEKPCAQMKKNRN